MTYRATVKMVVLAALISAGGAAYAKSGDRGEMFEKVDANGDGQVTAQELTAAAEARFAAADADKDGFLTPEEMAANRGGKRAERMLEKLDTDGNGTLDESELAAAQDGRQGKRAKKMMERVDTNKDGKLTLAEMTAKRDPAKMIERLDSNGDGTLSEDEFSKARKQGKKGHDRKKSD